MPLFEFRCCDCDHTFEELVRSSSENDRSPPCPECDSSATERQIAAFAARVSTSGGAAPPGGGCGGSCACH